jgi:hypothetical protein
MSNPKQVIAVQAPIAHDSPEFQYELLVHFVAIPDVGTRFADKLTDLKAIKKPWMRCLWGMCCSLNTKLGQWPRLPALIAQVTTLYDGVNLYPEDREDVEAFLSDAFSKDRYFDTVYYLIEGEHFIERTRTAAVCNKYLNGYIPSTDVLINELGNVRNQVRANQVRAVDPYSELILTDLGDLIPTGIRDLDLRLPGRAHSTKRTMFFLAFTNRGKSTMLRTIESHLVQNGTKTLTVTLEDSAAQVATKLYSNIAGIPASILYDPKLRTSQMLSRIREYTETLKSRHRIIDPFDKDLNRGYIARQALTVDDLDRIVDMTMEAGFEFQALSIDYLNRLRSKHKPTSRGDDESRDMRHISEELKDKIAKPYNIGIFTCGQATGDSDDKIVLEIKDMARSREAAWAFDVIATLGRPRNASQGFDEPNGSELDTSEEAEADRMADLITNEELMAGKCALKLVTFNLPKVRDGQTGKFPIYTDFCYGRFVAPSQMVQTILGPRLVEELLRIQTQSLTK